MSTRWSCRAFLPDQVPRATIEQILVTAGQTPSWCNTQPWHVDVTSGAATEQLRAAIAARIADGPATEPDIPFPESYEGVFQERRRTSGWQLYESVGIAPGDRAASARQMLRNFDFFGAPHLALITTERDLGTYGAVDCGLFIQTFLLAAHSAGLGAVPQAAIATQAPLLREHFAIGENRLILAGISFGYPDRDAPINGYRTERQSLGELATFHEDQR